MKSNGTDDVTPKPDRRRRRLYDPIPAEDAAPAKVETPAPAKAEAMLPAISPPQAQPKTSAADRIVTKYALISSGTALLPLPFVDMAAATGVQLYMLKKISDLYEIEFSSQRAKSLIGALIGGFHVGLFTGSLLKLVPVLGPVITMASNVVIASAVTYAVGKVFQRHFETGGSLLDFSPSRMKEMFKEEYEKGKRIVSRSRQG